MNYEVCPFSYWMTQPAKQREDAVEAARRGEPIWESERDVQYNDGALIKVGCTLIASIKNGEFTSTFVFLPFENGCDIHIAVAEIGKRLDDKKGGVVAVSDQSEWSDHRDGFRKSWLVTLPTHPKGGVREAVLSILKWTFSKKETV